MHFTVAINTSVLYTHKRFNEPPNISYFFHFVVFDASPKFPVGALYGSFYQLGNFDQCISIKQPKEELFSPLQHPIAGKYCLTDIAVYSVATSGDRVARSYSDEKVKLLHIRSFTCLTIKM